MIKTVIAIYPGRFQPMGKHHKEAFRWLENKFGAENTYIATSDKVDPPKSPLNFSENSMESDTCTKEIPEYFINTDLVKKSG